MGLVRDVKASTLAAEAQKALSEGDTVFTPFLNMPSSKAGMSSNVRDWAMMIAAVEEVGWRLDQWSVAADNKGRAQAYPLFRRI